MFNKNKENKDKDEQKQTETAPEKETETAKTAEAAPAEPEKKDPAAELEECKLKLAEAEKKHLLALADMDNLRKRCAKDMESCRFNVTADTIAPFLQVFDHFSMAVKASEKSDNLQSLLQGMKMIRDEFDRAFDELGVQCVDAVDQEFDPNLHEAVSQEASETVPAGKVIRQWNCGYKIGSKLLKPAMVVVSSGKPEEKTEEAKPEEEK